ncbi:MAG: YihY/virulence factor BrkB family protein [Pirellulales bacterium]
MVRWLKTRLWPHLRGTVYEWSNDNTSQYSAALAFYTAFSFFPLILVMLAGLGFVLRASPFGESNAQATLLKALRDHASAELADEVGKILSAVAEQLATNATVGGPTGFVMLLLGAVGIFANMEIAFYRIWKEYLPPVKSGWWPLIRRLIFGRLKAFLVVLGLGMFVVVTFVAGLVLTSVTKWIDGLDQYEFSAWVDDIPLLNEIPFGSWSIRAIQLSAGVLLNMALFLYLYRLFCPRRIGWTLTIQGCFVASLLWELGRVALTWYLTRGSLSAYGIIGSFIAMMTWFFYAWNVVFIGAEWAEVGYRLRFGEAAVPPTPSPTKSIPATQTVEIQVSATPSVSTVPDDVDPALDSDEASPSGALPLPVIARVGNAESQVDGAHRRDSGTGISPDE